MNNAQEARVAEKQRIRQLPGEKPEGRLLRQIPRIDEIPRKADRAKGAVSKEAAPVQ